MIKILLTSAGKNIMGKETWYSSMKYVLVTITMINLIFTTIIFTEDVDASATNDIRNVLVSISTFILLFAVTYSILYRRIWYIISAAILTVFLFIYKLQVGAFSVYFLQSLFLHIPFMMFMTAIVTFALCNFMTCNRLE